MAFKYFNVKNGLVTGNILLHAGNGVVSANAFTGNINVTDSANLGNVSNLKITGGVNGYVLQTDGTGNLSWVAQSGGPAGSSISNGSSNVSIATSNGNVTVSVNETANVATFTSLGANVTGYLSLTGNVTAQNANLGNLVVANYFSGDGSLLTNINVNNVANANYANYAGNAFSVSGSNVNGQVANSLVTGTVYTNAQPNITSVGTLTSLDVTGNVSANYFIGNGALLTGLPATYSNADVANYLPTYTGNFSANNANIGNLTANSISTTGSGGNLTGVNYVIANYFVGDGSLLTGLPATYSNADVANYLPTYTGNFSANNANITNLTANNISTTGSGGNLTGANYVIANYFSGNGSALSSLTGANVTGEVPYAAVANSIAVANVSGIGNIATLNLDGNSSNVLYGNGIFAAVAGGSSYGNSNVANYLPTYTGNLSPSNLTVSNTVNFASASNISFGTVSNVHITGGSNGYVLSTDGTGNLNWVESQVSAASFVVDNFTANGVQTVFTLSATPANINCTFINYNGESLLRSAYTVSGANVTFNTAPADGALIEVTTIALSATGGGGGGSSGASNARVMGYSLVFGL